MRIQDIDKLCQLDFSPGMRKMLEDTKVMVAKLEEYGDPMSENYADKLMACAYGMLIAANNKPFMVLVERKTTRWTMLRKGSKNVAG